MMIFFDVDDTLVDSASAHRIAVKKVLADYSLKVNPNYVFQEWIEITNRYLKFYFDKKITLNQQRVYRIKEFWIFMGQEINDKEARLIYQKYHQYFLHSCVAFSDVIPTLEQLKDFKLGIITNGTTSDQIDKLRNNGLLHYFNPIVISEEVGFSKPQQEIFDLAAKQTNQLLAECIFIGDSYELDYQGGHAAGMKAIWLDRNKTKIDFQCEKVHSLVELLHHPYFRKEK